MVVSFTKPELSIEMIQDLLILRILLFDEFNSDNGFGMNVSHLFYILFLFYVPNNQAPTFMATNQMIAVLRHIYRCDLTQLLLFLGP